jgi:hypothetical protein
MLKPTSPALVSTNNADSNNPDPPNQVAEYFPDVIFLHNK